MKSLKILIIISGMFIIQSCASLDEATRKLDKFSPDRKYALLMFDCKRFDVAERTTNELRRILLDFGFQIMDRNQFLQLLKQKGLTEKELVDDPTKAMFAIKGVDALIIGKIELDQGVSSGYNISSSGTGSSYAYIKECNTFVFDLTSAAILTNVNYTSQTLSVTSSTFTPEQVADKIARKLSPH